MFRRTLLSLVATAALAVPTVPALAAHVKHHYASSKHHSTVMTSATKAKPSKLTSSTKKHTLHASTSSAKRLHATHVSAKKMTSLSSHSVKHRTTTHHKTKSVAHRHVAVDPLA
jgi:hypothetical protein